MDEDSKTYRIRSVVKKSGRKHCWMMTLEDQSKVFIEKEVARLYGVTEGKAFSPDEWTSLLGKSDRAWSMKLALDILERRSRSEKEVRRKLRGKQVSKPLLESVVNELKRLNLVNDTDFAKRYAMELVSLKQAGRMLVRMELRKKGVPPDIAEEVLEDVFQNVDQVELARDLIRKKKKQTDDLSEPAVKKRLADFLARWGHTWDVIREALYLEKSLEVES